MGIAASESLYEDPAEQEAVLHGEYTLGGIARYIREGRAKNIVIMAGAGMSVSAGIPDFRSPGTGLYDNLAKYNLPRPEAVFDMSYFRENPKPFFMLAKELYPSHFTPTPSHFFIRLLAEKGLLLRCYTQNIDTLERHAGIADDLLVEAHGSFATAHCVACRQEYSEAWVQEEVFADRVPKCTVCDGVVKPDIVFFGESLPRRFAIKSADDMPAADLLIIIGTSLQVHPFAGLMHQVGPGCPRLLLNLTPVGLRTASTKAGLAFPYTTNYRDVGCLAKCDEGTRLLARLCGWEEELNALIESETGSPPPPLPEIEDAETYCCMASTREEGELDSDSDDEADAGAAAGGGSGSGGDEGEDGDELDDSAVKELSEAVGDLTV